MASTKVGIARGPRSLLVKVKTVARTMTSGTQIATLPRGARILGFILNGVASDAATTATVSIGSTAANSNEYVSAADVKTAAAGVGPTWLAGVSGALGGTANPPTEANLPIFAKYAETGTASTVGSWTVAIVFTAGNDLYDDTL